MFSLRDEMLLLLRNKTQWRTSRRLGVATHLISKDNGDLAIRYHNTDVLVIRVDRVHAYTGGWHTYTTLKRINTYLPRECPRLKMSRGNLVWTAGKNIPFCEGDFYDTNTSSMCRADGSMFAGVDREKMEKL